MSLKEKYVIFYFRFIYVFFFCLGVIFPATIIPRKILFCTYMIFFGMFAIYIVCQSSKQKSINNLFMNFFVDVRTWALVISIIIYRYKIIRYYENGDDLHQNIMWIALPILMYFFSVVFISYGNKITYDGCKKLIFSFGLGLFIFNIISIIFATLDNNAIKERQIQNFMLGPHSIAVTVYVFYSLIIISLVPFCVYYYKNNKKYLLVAGGGIILSLWYLIVMKTRTPPIILFVSIMEFALLWFIQKILDNGFVKYKKRMIYFFVFIIGIVICFVISYRYNIFNIREVYEHSFLNRNGGILNNVRYRIAKEGLLDLKKYPFGNNHSIYVKYAGTHVCWTDFAYHAGIIPFLLIVLWLVLIFIDMTKICISRKISLEDKLLIILPFMSLFFYSMTESLRDSYCFYVITLFAGMVHGKSVLLQNFEQ